MKRPVTYIRNIQIMEILLLKANRIPFKGELFFHKTPCCLNIIRRYSQGKISETCQNNDPNFLLKIRLPTIKKDLGRSIKVIIRRRDISYISRNSWEPTRICIMVCLPIIRMNQIILKFSTNSKLPLLRPNQKQLNRFPSAWVV
jgi:hypothetical protein